MRIAQHSILISRPPEVVFDYFTDFSKAALWRQYVKTMERVDHGPLKAGSRLHVTMELNGAPYEFDLDVLAFEPPRIWRHRSNEGEFAGYIEYRFDPAENGTRVTLSMEARPVTVYGWLALPLLLLKRGQSYVDQLPRLKRAVESDRDSA